MRKNTLIALRNATFMGLWWVSWGGAVALSSCQRAPVVQATPVEAVVPAPVQPAVPVVPPPPVDQILTLADSAGRTVVRLPPSDLAQVGDLVRVIDVEHQRTIATALVTANDEHGIQAVVIALADRSRPAHVGDHCVIAPMPLPLAEPPAPDVHPAHEPTPTVTIAEPPRAEPAHTESTPSPSESAESSVAHDTRDGHNVRARLEAERAYFALSLQVLKLPADSPEIEQLQDNLRRELDGLDGEPP